jgi:hypothetical protein
VLSSLGISMVPSSMIIVAADDECLMCGGFSLGKIVHLGVDVLYAAPQAHKIVKVALHREYSLGIIFTFSQGRKDLYHV